MEAMYFWDGEEVFTIDSVPSSQRAEDMGLNDYLAVNTRADPRSGNRYGYYRWNKPWVSVPLKEFPKLFQANLLVLGVT